MTVPEFLSSALLLVRAEEHRLFRESLLWAGAAESARTVCSMQTSPSYWHTRVDAAPSASADVTKSLSLTYIKGELTLGRSANHLEVRS